MKKEDILKAANDIVSEYMANDYSISKMNKLLGYGFQADLANNDEFVRVRIKRSRHIIKKTFIQYDCLELSVVHSGNADDL